MYVGVISLKSEGAKGGVEAVPGKEVSILKLTCKISFLQNWSDAVRLLLKQECDNIYEFSAIRPV